MIDIYKDLQPIDSIPSFTLAEIPQLSSVTTLGVDIETNGLDPVYCRIYMIGLILNGNIKLIYDKDEKATIQEFLLLLSRLIERYPLFLYGHNLVKFDLPFIIKRAEIYKFACPFQYRRKWSGELMQRHFPVGYEMQYTEITCPRVDIIDTQHLIRLNDSRYLFKNEKLKDCAIELGFRKEHRLELSPTEIVEAWENGHLDRLSEYLKYDLEDTHFLLYKLLPQFYYMKTFLPMSMQEIILSGNAKKINFLIERHYPDIHPKPDEHVDFEGGFTMCNPGFYKEAYKLDISSQYPFIMLFYRIGTRKDPDGYFFQLLKTLREKRLEFKKLGKTDPEAKAKSEALKVIINSCYGFLASKSDFNDFTSAPKVTEYGRILVKKIMEVIERNGGFICEVDTDGVIFTGPHPDAMLPLVMKEMPQGLEIEHEYTAKWIVFGGKKNYIVCLPDRIIYKGIYHKRDAMPLLPEFTKTVCERLYECPEHAQAYYEEIKEQITSGSMPLSKITKHRKIGKAEKFVLRYGKAGDYIDVYYGYDEPKPNAKRKSKKKVPVQSGPYNIEYYVGEIDAMYKNIMSANSGQEVIDLDEKIEVKSTVALTDSIVKPINTEGEKPKMSEKPVDAFDAMIDKILAAPSPLIKSVAKVTPPKVMLSIEQIKSVTRPFVQAGFMSVLETASKDCGFKEPADMKTRADQDKFLNRLEELELLAGLPAAQASAVTHALKEIRNGY